MNALLDNPIYGGVLRLTPETYLEFIKMQSVNIRIDGTNEEPDLGHMAAILGVTFDYLYHNFCFKKWDVKIDPV